ELCRRFFFQAEDGIRDFHVTGVQTVLFRSAVAEVHHRVLVALLEAERSIAGCAASVRRGEQFLLACLGPFDAACRGYLDLMAGQIGRAACRERVEYGGVQVSVTPWIRWSGR